MIDLKETLSQHRIDFEWYDHEPIFTYEAAENMKAEKGFTGTETKSLYLKDKQGNHYTYFTLPHNSIDFKVLKEITGKKLSIVRTEVMEAETGQKAGAVGPIGYEEPTPLILDKELLEYEKLVFAPGKPDATIVIYSKDLERICEILETELIVYDQP